MAELNAHASGQDFGFLQLLFRNDLEEEKHYYFGHRVLEENLRSLCVIPLDIQGKTIGSMRGRVEKE